MSEPIPYRMPLTTVPFGDVGVEYGPQVFGLTPGATNYIYAIDPEHKGGIDCLRITLDAASANLGGNVLVASVNPDDLPGAEAIPADMPNAPHADMPLEYSLQNFNALVAANTAMQSELAARDAMLEERRLRVVDLQTQLEDGEEHRQTLVARHAEVARQLSALQSTEKETKLEIDYLRDRERELQRKVDRLSGYLDRVIDDEESVHGEKTMTVPARKAAVGPDLSGIEPAFRRNARGDADYPMMSARLAPDYERERPRRY